MHTQFRKGALCVPITEALPISPLENWRDPTGTISTTSALTISNDPNPTDRILEFESLPNFRYDASCFWPW